MKDEKISTKTRHGLPAGLMIASFFLMLACCTFILGSVMIIQDDGAGLNYVLFAFPTAIISSFYICRFMSIINILTDYGTPVFKAAEHIKEIVNQVNIYGVDSLQSLIEKSMKEELGKVVKEEVGKK